MKITEVKKGMMVRISNNIKLTYINFGHNVDMLNMAGKVYKIDSIQVEQRGVMINNYIWSIKDIEPVTPVKKIKPQLFDTNQLDI